MDEKTEPAAPKTNRWIENWKSLLLSLPTILIYFAVLFSVESYIDNNSLTTLANGTATIGLVYLLLKIWVPKPVDKTWFEASKERLDFWQAVLVVTTLLLLIYHWHVKNFIKNLFPEKVTIVANVWDATALTPTPLPNCGVTLKFLDETIIELSTDKNGVIDTIVGINKKAAQQEVVVIVHKVKYKSDESIRRVSNDSLDIGAIPLDTLPK